MDGQRFYLGTYTELGGKGIGAGRIDPDTGRPEVESWTETVAQPSWLTLGPQALYAVGELTPGGLVHALRVQDDGTPNLFSTQPAGAKPAHLAVHPSGRFLFTAMYDGGTIGTHPIEDDGSLGPASDLRGHSEPGRPAHAHQVVFDPSGEFILTVDLGAEAVITYLLDAERSRLNEFDRLTLAPGSGPRHLVFHPTGKQVYIANELDSTVTVCDWADGRLTHPRSIPTLLEPFTGSASGPINYPGEILISDDGRFVYLSNRGSNTVSVFAVEEEGRSLRLLATPSCDGDWPRHLAIDHTGRWLYVANERSGELVWFPLDPQSGQPGPSAGRLTVPGVAQLYLAL
jgi:6-phosphogluconolactonase